MRLYKQIASILLLTALLLELRAQETYYPDSTWARKKPHELNIENKDIEEAVRFAMANETHTDKNLSAAMYKAYEREPGYSILGPVRPRGSPSGLILKNGYIVAEWGDLQRVDMTFSVTKSYLSTLVGLAADSRQIRSIDDPVHGYVWDETFEGPHNSKITWRHLLNQSSDWSGCLFDICDWADRPPSSGTPDEWKSRKLLEPGSQFEYNDVRVNLLAYALLQVWRKPLPALLKEKIMDPIGASSTWRWYGYENSFVNVDGLMVQSVSGGGHFGGGLFINTLDQARFGLLFLRKGKWKNQQLVSEKWINAVRQPSASNPCYGLMWWTNEKNDLAGVSRNIYYANGFGGNYIVIDPEHDLVIVTRWLDTGKLGELVKRVIDAVVSK